MTEVSVSDGFGESRERFEAMAAWLGGDDASGLDHAELEVRLDVEGRELLRRLFQDHLDLRAQRESRIEGIVDADGVGRGTVEGGHHRGLATVFGDVEVERLAYRRRGHPNLHLADAALNLPDQRHSHGLRRLAAVEATRGSFDDAVDAIGRASGQQLGKRQVEDLAQRAAADFDEFYATRAHTAGEDGDVLVLSCDGRGIVMRPEALRAATAKAAAAGTTKLATRLSKGEKRNRKRMAEVGAVYDLSPVPRTPADILARSADPGRRCAGVLRSSRDCAFATPLLPTCGRSYQGTSRLLTTRCSFEHWKLAGNNEAAPTCRAPSGTASSTWSAPRIRTATDPG